MAEEEGKAEEVLPIEEHKYLETNLLRSLREKQIAQTIMPINPQRRYIGLPGIHNEFYYNPDTVDEDIEVVTSALAKVENRVLLSGHCPEWLLMGIEGLTTATGRHRMEFTGDLTESVMVASTLLEHGGITGNPIVLLVPEAREEMLRAQILYVKEQGIVDRVIVADGLYSETCTPDSVLLVSVHEDHFWTEQELSPRVGVFDAADQVYVTLREAVMPVIEVPESIVEIYGVNG